MSSKVSYDVGGFQFLTFANENGEPLHVHVAKGKNHFATLKFWYRNSEWILDSKQSSLRITAPELQLIISHLNRNKADIINSIVDFHSDSIGYINAFKLE